MDTGSNEDSMLHRDNDSVSNKTTIGKYGMRPLMMIELQLGHFHSTRWKLSIVSPICEIHRRTWMDPWCVFGLLAHISSHYWYGPLPTFCRTFILL
jgi:hypothetical protein